MCGVAGFIDSKNGKGRSIEIASLMTRSLKHRGPDDSGVDWVGGSAYFGNRRLAVLDLSRSGHMPMKSLSGDYWITYNGEVYNYNELRKHLKGARFKGRSDTEVILKLFVKKGVKSFNRLRGMFALAIYDNKKGELVLARDHLGIKPLYYYFDGELFAFASEIKALMKHPEIKKKRQLNEEAVSLFFSTGFGSIPAPYSAFKNIYKVPAGHYLRFRNNKIEIKQFWSLKNIEQRVVTPQAAALRVNDLLEESVKEQMVADVPVGSFLSGGIDSSTIVALMTQNTKRKVKTFSISFEDKSYDESSYARQMAKYLGTDHHEERFSDKDILGSIDQVLSMMDEPMADASILPTYLLSRVTRKQVTVALSGDGGDELFAGYPTYLAHKVMSLYQLMPDFVTKTTKKVANRLRASDKNLSFEYNLKRLVNASTKHPALTHLDFMAPIKFSSQKNLLLSKYQNNLAPKMFKNRFDEVGSFDKQKRLQYLDLYYFLISDGLVKTDRTSNMNSLEVRVPFLSTKLAEYAYSLPGNYHFDGRTTKKLLKVAAKKYLPDNIINRSKKGFGVPMTRWLKTDLSPMIDEFLNERHIKSQGIFNEKYVSRLVKEHRLGQQNHRMALWSLLVFEYWYKKWM